MLPQEKVNRKRLIKSQSMTTSKYGLEPEKRSIEQLIESGIVVLDKPAGPTSHQVTAWVKDIVGIPKAGHGGTLDPKVTGLLLVTLGSSSNAQRALHLGGKEYVGVMRLHGEAPKKKVKEIFEEFTGRIYQLPPVRSAVKRQQRIREIYYLKCIEIEKRLVLFQVGCESGTYIRTLCHDIGDAMGIGAHMAELRRTKTGAFLEGDSVTLHDLKDAYVLWEEEGDESQLRKAILPMERILEHLPKIVVKDSAVDAVSHGANLALPGVAQVDSDIKKEDTVAIFSLKGEGIAMGKASLPAEKIMDGETGIAVDTQSVFMAPGTYPKLWRKK